MNLKAIELLRKAENGAFKRASGYAIIDKTTLNTGKILVAYPADGAGKLHAWMWDTQCAMFPGWLTSVPAPR